METAASAANVQRLDEFRHPSSCCPSVCRRYCGAHVGGSRAERRPVFLEVSHEVGMVEACMDMLPGIIIVLGAPNHDQGRLSSLARERCDQAIALAQTHPGYKILLTGGYGEHFNRTSNPHAWYTRNYLLARQIPAHVLLGWVESSNTIEDAELSWPVVEQSGVTQVIVVTSDFHVKRAEYLFRQTFPAHIHLSFSGSQTHLPPEELARLSQHEHEALSRIIATRRRDRSGAD
ncbi:hypothetical protein GF339_04370 [candidate division KSB3 bacterium]|uniref:DUF218 domain-containing protein n=1 Tax=candidate division KSB3 bacterium TaxID=2044937 RepID=A0A9D5JTB2_9BACT|nr:hypothetical protein [candidate division KSB3 bacterium]MBD3323795.1 hypothetical protein [candidate division KSB3 bacterium]